MQEKQEATESDSGSSIEPPGGSGERALLSNQIAKVTGVLIESYLGHSYKAKDGSSELPEVWRWLNATFGSFSLAFAILVLQLSSPDKAGDALLSRLATLFSESTIIGILAPVFFVLLGFCMLGAVVATSIKSGGPMRLFIMGMVLLSLPLIIAARVG